MKQEPIASRELDAQVAEKVMGWRVYTSGRGSLVALETLPGGNEIDHIISTTHPWEEADYHPSRDISAAFQVVEKMRELGYTWFRVEREDPANNVVRPWVAGFHKPRHQTAYWSGADTAPLAICLAALQAVEPQRGADVDRGREL